MTEPSAGSAAVLPPPPPPETTPAQPPQRRPPRRLPRLPRIGLRQLGWLVLAAVLTDIALHSGVSTVSASAAVLVVSTMLIGPFSRRNPVPAALSGAAVIFGGWLAMRASTWLTWLNALAVCALLLGAAATVRPISVRLGTSTIMRLTERAAFSRFGFRVLASAVQPLRTQRASQLVPLLRGGLIAAVPVAVLTGLLASADAVFANSITTDFDPTSWIGHTLLTLSAAVAVAGLVAVMAEPKTGPVRDWRPLGTTEALVLLVSIGVLYGGFAVVQLLSAFGRLDAVLDDQGLTYAEYARSGFFQLLWVAGLTALLLAAVRLLIAHGSPLQDRLVRTMGAGVALLTTLIVAVAVVRLRLYTDAFGQTTLRWYCTAFAWMLGIAFVAIAAGHSRRVERHVGRVLIGLALVTLFAVNLLNPEARVAEHNLARADATESLDANYLAGLSADAWPVLVANEQLIVDRLSPARLRSADVFVLACERADTDRGYGPFGFNLAIARLDC